MHLSRRSFLTGTAAAAAFSVIGLPRKSAAAETPFQILTGSVLPVSNPQSAYDAWHLTQVKRTVDGFNADPNATNPTAAVGTVMDWNYYDLALSCYLLYARTGDPTWRTAGQKVAVTWRGFELVRNIPGYLAGNYSLQYPPSRAMSSLGVAAHAADTGDTVSRNTVHQMALISERQWPVFDGRNGDMREAGYSLMASVASTLLGDDHRAGALKNLNSFLSGQKSDGRWENIDTGSQVPAIYYTLNFMMGLAMEALIMYDRVIGDTRIVPSLQAATSYLWNTQWVPVVPNSSPQFGAFQYANINSGTVSQTPYANLSGLIAPAWGYLYAKTGNAAYKTQGDVILAGMVAGGAQPAVAGAGIYNSKQSNQEFRSSPRYLGWTAGQPAATTGLPVAPSNLTVR